MKNVASERMCGMTLIGCLMWVHLRLEQKRYYYLEFQKNVCVSKFVFFIFIIIIYFFFIFINFLFFIFYFLSNFFVFVL